MKNTYAGLFLTSLAALMLEILLTRVFSVATWYYFAFFAISVAMFGFTVGALLVYLKPGFFGDEALLKRLAQSGILFGFAIDLSLLIFLSIPFSPRLTGNGIFSTVFVYLVISLPFVASGVIVCLCLTRFPKKTGLLYAADLIGAGIGAFLIFPVLNAMDAPTAIFLAGAVAALGAVFFARSMETQAGMRLGSWSAAAFICLTLVMLVNLVYQPVRVEWVKTSFNVPEFERWNGFSRIAVYPFRLVKKPYSWGLSSAYRQDRIIGERMIDIDGVSETVMTMFDGDFKSVEHLKYDVTAVAHYLKDNASVFIIGVGGGRDVLAAKAFGQKRIVGAEINNRTIDIIKHIFSDFTGHLDRLPGVTIINDEARSAITRTDERFDLIQASCIATWSATTAGAFSLAENSLYTVEAWKIFYDHLTPDGVMSYNRWYSPDYPAQLLRMASLASYTLKKEGAADPARHIAIIKSEGLDGDMPSATIIVSRSPFSPASLGRLKKAVKDLNFQFVFDPDGYRNPAFSTVIEKAGDEAFYKTTRLDLSPSTDDRPFFFYMLRLKDVFSSNEVKLNEQRFSMEGITMLYILLGVSVVLSAVFIIGPLLIAGRRGPIAPRTAALGVLFFASIGFGYILIEIAQLQKLIIFLGHPTYSITVVIFSMLISSGIGSIASGYFMEGGVAGRRGIVTVLTVLLALFVLTVFIQPGVLASFEKGPVMVRIAVALLFLMPIGFFMGMPFTFGMSIASRVCGDHTPWFWAANGATGVVSSVLAVCISIAAGFTATFLTGIAFYVSAFVFLYLFSRAGSARAGIQ